MEWEVPARSASALNVSPDLARASRITSDASIGDDGIGFETSVLIVFSGRFGFRVGLGLGAGFWLGFRFSLGPVVGVGAC